MKRFCHNCGDPVEEGEVFCDKCGTKIVEDDHIHGNHQTNNYQVNNHGYYQGHQQVNNAPAKKTRTTAKYFKIMGISAIVTFIVALLIIIAVKLLDNSDKQINTDPNKNPITNNTNNNNNNNPTEPISAEALATWYANIEANASYSVDDRKVNVEYLIALKNEGTGNALNVNVYLNPIENDENALYLGIITKTIVNYEEDILKINSGEIRDIQTKFYYDNIDPANISQKYLQDIANGFIRIPILVEWQENGKTYTQSLMVE